MKQLKNIKPEYLESVLLSIKDKDTGSDAGWVVEEVYAPKVLEDIGHIDILNLNEIITNFKMFDFISKKDGVVFLTSVKYSSSLYRDSVNSIESPGNYLETTIEVLNQELADPDGKLKAYFSSGSDTKISLSILYFTHDVIRTLKASFTDMFFIVEYFHTNHESKFKINITYNNSNTIKANLVNDFTKIHASIADKAFKVEVYEHILNNILKKAGIKQTNNIATVRSELNKLSPEEKRNIVSTDLRNFIDNKKISHDLYGKISLKDMMGYPYKVEEFIANDKREFKQYRKLFYVQKRLGLKDQKLYQYLNSTNKGGKKVTKTDIFASVIMGYSKNRETLNYSVNISSVDSDIKLSILKDMISSERGHIEDGQSEKLEIYNNIIDKIKEKEDVYLNKGFQGITEKKLYLEIVHDIILDKQKMQ